MSSDGSIAASDGTRLAYRDRGGTGPSIVLLHGLGVHLEAMENLAKELERDFRIVSMDLRWSGHSGSSPAYRWDLLVDDVESLISALGLGDALVCGHSWGGIVATHYGATHPGSPGIVNLDGWGFGGPDLYEGMDAEDVVRRLDKLRANVDPLAGFQREGDDEWSAAARVMLREIWRGSGVPHEELDAWTERSLFHRDGGAWAVRPDATAYEWLRDDARVFDLLADLKCPALVVVAGAGQGDQMSQAYCRGVASRLASLAAQRSNITVVTIDDADHNSLLSVGARAVAFEISQFAKFGNR